jgi:hypothetical protein
MYLLEWLLDIGIGKPNSVCYANALFSQNQIGATMDLFLIDLIDGKVTEEDKQRMRNYLLKIMKRNSPQSVSQAAARIQHLVSKLIPLEALLITANMIYQV